MSEDKKKSLKKDKEKEADTKPAEKISSKAKKKIFG